MKIRRRVFPVLTIKDGGLVKTVQFKKGTYLGDPINAVRIFNEKEVDELVLLDISEDRSKRGPDFTMLKDIVDEAFMPLTYGGGIRSLEDADQLIKMGFEKVLLNSLLFEELSIVKQIVEHLGSQSVVASLDYRTAFGKTVFFSHGGNKKLSYSMEQLMEMLDDLQVGEIVLHSIDKDGTRSGYDTKLLAKASSLTGCPLIALGGAKNLADIKDTFVGTKVSAAAAGHLFVFYGKLNGVLINFPSSDELFIEDNQND